MVFNATFNNISVIPLWSVLLVEEIEVPEENHRPSAIVPVMYSIITSIQINVLLTDTLYFRGNLECQERKKIPSESHLQIVNANLRLLPIPV